MNILGIIPVRLESTRLPRKPLIELHGKTMLQRVYEQCIRSQSVVRWVIATPDEELYTHCRDIGAECIITSNLHKSGTDRCAEVIVKIDGTYDAVINVQGDEPLIRPEQIDQLAEALDANTQVATMYRYHQADQSVLSPDSVKLVTDNVANALYFSRANIPYLRDSDADSEQTFKLHVGMYAFGCETLKKIATMAESPLEKSEKLEQLRWLENGLKIQCVETKYQNIGVDTPEDVEKVKTILKNNG